MLAKLVSGLAFSLMGQMTASAEMLELKVARAEASRDNVPPGGAVDVLLTDESVEAAAFTESRVGRQIHIRADGILLMSPFIGGPMNGPTIQLSGGMTPEAAKNLAFLLNHSAKLTIDDEPVK
ncbi:preprotein translocase subunit SecD [Rhizobium petrolearium]|uniref:SecDF P1 head subdomain-containing protein n=1 Tax=Neorhizobium petrolearium TaxID=515361 RepID=UPI001AE6C4E1|nr:hypothetical protein [Neorhizobium petrolearium]MBP1844022.1 preprotein translocase subunit SecD [Neorhizobium petrolearium]